MPALSLPNREDTGGRMQLIRNTIRALEIRGGATEGTTKGSLLNVIKRTVTSSGYSFVGPVALLVPQCAGRRIIAANSHDIV